jgi:hypothetical protein
MKENVNNPDIAAALIPTERLVAQADELPGSD